MKQYISIICLFILATTAGCKKFLDKKPNQTLATPTTLAEAQALLDAYVLMNGAAPNMGPESDDDFYMTDAYFNAVSTTVQDNYLWKKDIVNDAAWSNMYKIILYTNTSLETLDRIPVTVSNEYEWKKVQASALFQRAVAFYFVAQYFATPYKQNTAASTPGIPLRLDSDINTRTVRNNLAETYTRIINDIAMAAPNLPASTLPVSRPSKAAAFGFLARVYLTIEDYPKATNAADSALYYNSTLIDYNSVSATATIPFAQFNAEVLYPYHVAGATRFSVNNYVVDTVLYNSYHNNDLRKTLFYKNLAPVVGYGFKGNYEGNTHGQLFCGIAVDEVYLIKAEAAARTNNIQLAMNTLNQLLIKRYRTGTFVPMVASNPETALQIILTERRKELAGRGLRWLDLRRLNQYPAYAKTLTRKNNGNLVQLLPDSRNYTFYIPQTVIDFSGIEQNIRE